MFIHADEYIFALDYFYFTSFLDCWFVFLLKKCFAHLCHWDIGWKYLQMIDDECFLMSPLSSYWKNMMSVPLAFRNLQENKVWVTLDSVEIGLLLPECSCKFCRIRGSYSFPVVKDTVLIDSHDQFTNVWLLSDF